MPSSSESEEVQRALGASYAIERELGRGGMGAVYLARDLALDRPVAIKVLPPELAVRPELRERFLRETRTAASFSHPNIVPVHAVEERGAVLCFVMGFVDGETLAQRIRRAGPLPAPEIVRMMQEVAWALSYAHGRGVIHRDIKPDNILIERATGRALVMDFGIARSASSASAGLTRVGEVVGTPHYMSPEQAAGDVVDARSDLYSLGVVAFTAATGHVPFDADSTPAILAMHLTRSAPALAAERPDLPSALTGAVDRLLAKDPADRFPTGEALVEALDAVRSSRPEVAPAIRLFQQSARQVIRNALLLLVFAGYISSSAHGTVDRIVMLAMLLAAALALLMQVFVRMRELARQGFRFEDLRDAAGVMAAEEREARAQLVAAPDWARRRRRRWIWLLLGFATAIGMVVWSLSLRVPRPSGMYSIGYGGMALVLLGAMLGMTTLVFAVAGGGGAARFNRRLDWLWSGPLGRRIFGLAARGVGGSRGRSTMPAAIPTGSARGILATLPRTARRRLAGVESAIRRLEEEASQLTLREAQLEAALTDAGAPAGASAATAEGHRALLDEVGAARRAAAERREAIGAILERVRLQLLRVRSGLGSPEDVTRELNAG